jgi:hypothetical protein
VSLFVPNSFRTSHSDSRARKKHNAPELHVTICCRFFVCVRSMFFLSVQCVQVCLHVRVSERGNNVTLSTSKALGGRRTLYLFNMYQSTAKLFIYKITKICPTHTPLEVRWHHTQFYNIAHTYSHRDHLSWHVCICLFIEWHHRTTLLF